jgi:hypothetical protein
MMDASRSAAIAQPQTVPPPSSSLQSQQSRQSQQNLLFQLHHPDSSALNITSTTSTRPYPIRTMSSSAAHSPFFSASSSPYPHHHPRSGSSHQPSRERGASPDSVASSASTSGASRFGVIGAVNTAGSGAPGGGQRWGASGLRNTLARGSLGASSSGLGGSGAGAWMNGGTATRSNSFSGPETRSPRVSVSLISWWVVLILTFGNSTE